MAVDKYFEVPFALNGDRTPVIPDPIQGPGTVSYDQGWGPLYELDQVANPATALDVERTSENDFKYSVTQLLKTLQEQGVIAYDARYNYDESAMVTAPSTNRIYRAIVANGPVLANVIAPEVDALRTVWAPLETDVAPWVNATEGGAGGRDYPIGSIVKGSDLRLYYAKTIQGGAGGIFDPTINAGGQWELFSAEIQVYNAAVNYLSKAYVRGSNGALYRGDINNGPSTGAGVVGPVGDATGTWVLIAGGIDGMTTEVLTADDPTWAPHPLAKSIKFSVTGGGGGGGGGKSGTGAFAAGCGSAGATAIKTISLPFDATYAVVVGGGGAGSSNDVNGVNGADSTVNGASLAIVTGGGGVGGVHGGTPTTGSTGYPAADGGVASGGDQNVDGGSGTMGHVAGGAVAQVASGAASIYGGGGRGSAGNGLPGIAYGSGGGGHGSVNPGATSSGGDGADGVVVIEQYF